VTVLTENPRILRRYEYAAEHLSRSLELDSPVAGSIDGGAVFLTAIALLRGRKAKKRGAPPAYRLHSGPSDQCQLTLRQSWALAAWFPGRAL
jgi:hypothetical protein